MGLSTEDVDAIGKLLDQRLEAYDRRQAGERRKEANVRRFWRWFWIALFVISSVVSWYAVKGFVDGVQDNFKTSEAEMAKQMSDMKIAYQKQLAQDKQMQQDRAAAAAAVHYQSGQSQGDFDAGLIKQTIALMAKAQAAKAKAKTATGDDADMADLQGVSDAADGASNILMQLLLHETDSANDTPAERAAVSDSHQRAPTPAEQAVPLHGQDAAPAAGAAPPVVQQESVQALPGAQPAPPAGTPGAGAPPAQAPTPVAPTP
jgi:hypothetical protein